jgi:hypothetical protein
MQLPKHRLVKKQLLHDQSVKQISLQINNITYITSTLHLLKIKAYATYCDH